MFIIVGLGNIGPAYTNTFHNLGFVVADKLASRLSMDYSKEKYKSIIAEGRHNGQAVIIAKPTTYMNKSGEAVALLKKKYKDARIIIAVDDIDLERGKVRYRERGRSGTHNGLRSIVEFIGEEFELVKVGCGRDKSMDLADYVLSKIKAEDRQIFEEATDKAVEMILEKINWIWL